MPRKTRVADQFPDRCHRASMRPRPDAAENETVQAGRVEAREASMRPRPDAAENPRRGRPSVVGDVASMRPRPDAAENVITGVSAATAWRLQ